jgi:hypothetical protein
MLASCASSSRRFGLSDELGPICEGRTDSERASERTAADASRMPCVLHTIDVRGTDDRAVSSCSSSCCVPSVLVAVLDSAAPKPPPLRAHADGPPGTHRNDGDRRDGQESTDQSVLTDLRAHLLAVECVFADRRSIGVRFARRLWSALDRDGARGGRRTRLGWMKNASLDVNIHILCVEQGLWC